MSIPFTKLNLELSNPNKNLNPIDRGLFSADTRVELIEVIAELNRLHTQLESELDGFFTQTQSRQEIASQINYFNLQTLTRLQSQAEINPELARKILVIEQVLKNSTYDYLFNIIESSTNFITEIIRIIELLISQLKISKEEKDQLFRAVLENKATLHSIACIGFTSKEITSQLLMEHYLNDFEIRDNTLKMTETGYQRLRNKMAEKGITRDNQTKFNGCTAIHVPHPNFNNSVTAHTQWILQTFSKYYQPFEPRIENPNPLIDTLRIVFTNALRGLEQEITDTTKPEEQK